ncbi:hypothetical protein [Chitinophaga sp. sic0106]|uniref:hypothetical protein n=1 Tax=Chitinophaga sp. sic0106 TaxID=2854785 RepID=UPI001C478893|nr:hypothetical protein [Chitinophaga sp. sic0106]MBV7531893.1 hypothetical protein [Chitinophaga sp. sic0106]
MKVNPLFIDVEIDELTNSIVCTRTGERFDTIVSPLTMEEAKKLTRRKKWRFNWQLECQCVDRIVYKLTIINRPKEVHGVMSCTDCTDHYFVHLIENAPANVGKLKLFSGVAPNLFAFVCKLSLEQGYGGEIGFVAKTKLVDYYKDKLGAQLVGHLRMKIPEIKAKKLIHAYFKKENDQAID